MSQLIPQLVSEAFGVVVTLIHALNGIAEWFNSKNKCIDILRDKSGPSRSDQYLLRPFNNYITKTLAAQRTKPERDPAFRNASSRKPQASHIP